MTSANGQTYQTSRIRTKIRRSRLTAVTLIRFLWDVKEPTPLFEKSRGRRPRCCSQHTHITLSVGWIKKAHKWTESDCQWRLCMLTSELITHMLKCIVRGHVCCSLMHDSLFFHSFIHSRDTIALSRVFSSPNTLETPRNEAVYLILSSTESFKTKRNLLRVVQGAPVTPVFRGGIS